MDQLTHCPQSSLVFTGGSPAKPQQQQQQYAGVAPLGIATAGSGDMFSGLAVPGGPEVAPQVGMQLASSVGLRSGPLLLALFAVKLCNLVHCMTAGC